MPFRKPQVSLSLLDFLQDCWRKCIICDSNRLIVCSCLSHSEYGWLDYQPVCWGVSEPFYVLFFCLKRYSMSTSPSQPFVLWVLLILWFKVWKLCFSQGWVPRVPTALTTIYLSPLAFIAAITTCNEKLKKKNYSLLVKIEVGITCCKSQEYLIRNLEKNGSWPQRFWECEE